MEAAEEAEEAAEEVDAAHAALLQQAVLPHVPHPLPTLRASALLLDGTNQEALQQLLADLQVSLTTAHQCWQQLSVANTCSRSTPAGSQLPRTACTDKLRSVL
jgi:hypothetical protein